MPREPFHANDLSLISRVLLQHPEVEEVVRAVKQVSANAKYPIATYDELAQALGGEDATVTFRGQSMKVMDARKFIPAYYFPITNEADLVAKIQDLQRGAAVTPTLPAEMNVKWAAMIERPAGQAPPAISMEEVHKISEFGIRNSGGVGELRMR